MNYALPQTRTTVEARSARTPSPCRQIPWDNDLGVTMDDGVDEDVPQNTLEMRVHGLQSSSTNAQVHALEGILAQLRDERAWNDCDNECLLTGGLELSDDVRQGLHSLLPHLLSTYPRQLDRRPRKLVQECLRLYLKHDPSGKIGTGLGSFLTKESQKLVIAATSALVLLEWAGLVEEELAKRDTLDETLLRQTCLSQAQFLDKCLDCAVRSGLQHAALVVARRGVRVLLKSTHGEQALEVVLAQLTSGSTASPTNSALIGVVCGTAARLSARQPQCRDRTDTIVDFYVKVILGHKTTLPDQQVHGFDEFFMHFATRDHLSSAIVPTIERAILRSPENVLLGPIVALAHALPASIDLGDLVVSKLVKPLLSSMTSTNTTVRDGAAHSLASLLARQQTVSSTEKIDNELLANVKASKAAGFEQRGLICNCLRDAAPTPEVSLAVVQGLLPVAAKEANESALRRELEAIVAHLPTVLAAGILTKDMADTINKGFTDKRPLFKKSWLLNVAEALLRLEQEPEDQVTGNFIQGAVGIMADTYTELSKAPLPAAQNSIIASTFVIPAFTSHKILSRILDNTRAKSGVVIEATINAQSYLLNSRVYTKLSTSEDQQWLLRALLSVHTSLEDASQADQAAWGRAVLHLLLARECSAEVRRAAATELASKYLESPAAIGSNIVQGIWSYLQDESTHSGKNPLQPDESTASSLLRKAVAVVSPSHATWAKHNLVKPVDVLTRQAISTTVLYGPDLIPHVEWVDNLLYMGLDPGKLADDHTEALMQEIMSTFRTPRLAPLSNFGLAACRAAATLAFVSPHAAGTAVVERLTQDLSDRELHALGTVEATIAAAPDGVLVVDPNEKVNGFVENKNVKDYDTLKWEEELRSQLAKKKGTPQKKLSPDQQAKVDTQLAHEKQIRQKVHALSTALRRGAGIVNALAHGPPTEARTWMSPAVNSLRIVLAAGGSLFVDHELVTAYLACSRYVSDRLGSLRPFVGVAFLRTIGGPVGLSQELQEEPLEDLGTRVLYRLRFAAEQRPFDTASLAYCLPLIFAVIDNCGIGKPANTEDNDAQILLALEFLSFQMSAFSDECLPRAEVLSRLFESMQRYPQHYRLLKDSIQEFAAAVSETLQTAERDILLTATTSDDTSIRTAALQAVQSELDLSQMQYSVHIWIACQDAEEDNAETALAIWEESEFTVQEPMIDLIPEFLHNRARSTRAAAAKALAQALSVQSEKTTTMRISLQTSYQHEAQPLVPKADRRGIVQRGDLVDPWERRSGLALAFREMTAVYSKDDLLALMEFMVKDGPLCDRNGAVRQEMLDAGTVLVTQRGKEVLEQMMALFEKVLQDPDKATQESDWVNEAVIVLYGSLARHLPSRDKRLKDVLAKLIETLATPSESVQYAVANCLPPLVRAAGSDSDSYIASLLEQLLESKKYATRRGAAYGLAGVVKGKGVSALRKFRIMSTLRSATEDKKSAEKRQGAMMAYELFSLILGRTFEPYVVDLLPQLLSLFGDANAMVRDACLDTAKTCFASLSSYGVHKVLPELLAGLEESQWRSKKGACDLLGAMAYLDPQQLAQSLPDIIPPLTAVLTDTHKEVRAAANISLKRFGEVISNPEVKSLVEILLKALSDPTKYTEDALDGLIRVSFVHYLDAPSLALVVRILERGLSDRSATKRKAAQIIGSLAHLTDKRDISVHLPILTSGLRLAAIDPVPATRATAAKALGSLVEKLGEDALPDLIPSLMSSLRVDTGASDRLGSAQALSEVLAGLGTTRLEETLPSILQNVSSTRAVVREGFMTLFIYLPACFGNSFANYLAQIIPAVLSGLADDVEAIRDTALRAGRLLVKNFATKSIDLLLPELQRGLADDSYRIRLSSVELIGDLLFNLTGISAKADTDEADDNAAQAGQSLLEVLGEDKRNRVLSSLYICRCDTSGLVRAAAIAVWKALVATPRTLREIVPTLTQMIIARLGSSNAEQKHIAANALGEVIRKSGEGIFNSLLPTLEEGLELSTDADNKQGICIALKEVITAAAPESIEDNEARIITIVRTALTDSDSGVREAAAEAFDALQGIVGRKAVDKVLPHLLNLLQDDEEAENALSALLTLLTEQTRANAILPNLIPTLLSSPITSFNARALASLSKVGGTAMNRRLPTILNSLADNTITCKEADRKAELDGAFDAVLCSVDEYDGLNAAMSVMLQMVKHDDHRRRAIAATHLRAFFDASDVDYSRYNQDLIRVLLISFDDRDEEVVSAAWEALSTLQTHLRKEEMESLTSSTCAIMKQVGTPGHNLPGFLLPKGIQPVLAIFLQGLMNGTAEQRLQAASGISDMIDKSAAESLKPFVTQLTGPLIRVVGERAVEVRIAIVHALNQLLDKIPTLLRPFLPQLQRTFTKCIADPTSEILRNRATRALSTLVTLTPRIDPLIAELTTGAKAADAGVRNSMLKALQEVVSKVGAKISETSRDAILSLMDAPDASADDMMVTMARLLGSMVEVLPAATASVIIKSRVLVQPPTSASILALNAVLAQSPTVLTSSHLAETRATLLAGLQHGATDIQHASVLGIGKLLLGSPDSDVANGDLVSDTEANRPLIDTLANKIKPGGDIDTRRLSLVVIRTLARYHNQAMRPFLSTLLLPIYQSLRDMVIPIKLAAEACFITLFDVVESELAVYEQFTNSDEAKKTIPPPILRQIGEYMKRVGLKLGAQKREQKEAEGGVKGSLGLSSDEQEDEREVWSVGRVEVDGTFSNDD